MAIPVFSIKLYLHFHLLLHFNITSKTNYLIPILLTSLSTFGQHPKTLTFQFSAAVKYKNEMTLWLQLHNENHTCLGRMSRVYSKERLFLLSYGFHLWQILQVSGSASQSSLVPPNLRPWEPPFWTQSKVRSRDQTFRYTFNRLIWRGLFWLLHLLECSFFVCVGESVWGAFSL